MYPYNRNCYQYIYSAYCNFKACIEQCLRSFRNIISNPPLHTTGFLSGSRTKQQTGSNEKEGGHVFFIVNGCLVRELVRNSGRPEAMHPPQCAEVDTVYTRCIYALGQPYRFKPGKRPVPGCNVNGSGSSNLLILSHFLFGSRTNSFSTQVCERPLYASETLC